jgi:hypothetical protein
MSGYREGGPSALWVLVNFYPRHGGSGDREGGISALWVWRNLIYLVFGLKI